MSNREEFEKYEFSKKPEASKELMFQRFTSDDLGIDEQGYVGKYYNSFMQEKWELWQARVPEGYVVVPVEPSDYMIDVGMDGFCFPLDNGCFNNHDLIFAYRAMIEAVEK